MNEVEVFIDAYTGEQKEIMHQLRIILLNAAPGIEEKMSYKVPFYYYFGRLCYFNPNSKGVDLGFCRGYAISSRHTILESKGRTEVKTITFQTKKDIKDKVLKAIIQEAILVNEFYGNKKKKK